MPSWRRLSADQDWPLQFNGRDLSHRASARSLGAADARDLRCRRAGRHFHRPGQRREQSRLLRNDLGDQSVRRAAAAALRRLPARLDQSVALGRTLRSSQTRASIEARLAELDRHGGSLARQRHRRLALSAARAGRRSQSQAPHRPWRHRARRRADLLQRALWRRRRACADARWLRTIRTAAYRASAKLAAEKGRLSRLRRGHPRPAHAGVARCGDARD